MASASSRRGTVMSSRQRMLAALRRQPHDHVPLSLYIQQGPGWREPLYWRNQLERAERMLALGLDPTIDIWLPDVRPAPDVKVTSTRRRDGDRTLLTKTYHTPDGDLRQVVHETDDWCDQAHGPWIPTTLGIEWQASYEMHLFDDWNVSRRLEPWVKGPGDLDALSHLIRVPTGVELDAWRHDARRAIDFARRHDLLVVARRTIVGDAFEWFCDINWFLMQLADDTAFVDRFLGIFQAWALRQLDLVLELDIDVVQYRGWYEIATLWGVNGWTRFLGPLIAAQGRRVEAADKLFCYLLPEGQGTLAPSLSGTGIDVLQGVDPRMLHTGDLNDLHAALGERMSFWGGVDAEVTLKSGSVSAIDAAVERAVAELNGHDGLILSAFLFPGVPQEGIMAMLDAWRQYRA